MENIGLSTCKRICQHRFAIENEDPHKGCPIQNICMYCFEQPPCYWDDDMIAEDTARGREYIMKGVRKDEQHNDSTSDH